MLTVYVSSVAVHQDADNAESMCKGLERSAINCEMSSVTVEFEREGEVKGIYLLRGCLLKIHDTGGHAELSSCRWFIPMACTQELYASHGRMWIHGCCNKYGKSVVQHGHKQRSSRITYRTRGQRDVNGQPEETKIGRLHTDIMNTV
ncbi:hypothetical protein DFH29DRAFT_1069679, partial [Suillus ampliporus]